MSTIVKRLGWWFFCKIGDPIFSPSQAALGDAVCLWCGKQHGNLTNESAWAFMAQRFVEAFTSRAAPSKADRWRAEGANGEGSQR